MVHWLGRVLALSHSNRQLVLRALVWLTITDFIVRAGALRRRVWRPLVSTIHTVPVISDEDVRKARCYAAWLDVAAKHHVVSARCLHRSLALHFWLRSEGIMSELKIGVMKEGTALRAHAWVQLGEQIINDSPHAVARFAVLEVTDAPLTAHPAMIHWTATAGFRSPLVGAVER